MVRQSLLLHNALQSAVLKQEHLLLLSLVVSDRQKVVQRDCVCGGGGIVVALSTVRQQHQTTLLLKGLSRSLQSILAPVRTEKGSLRTQSLAKAMELPPRSSSYVAGSLLQKALAPSKALQRLLHQTVRRDVGWLCLPAL